ncbi:hypothetical protein DH2020_005855 [Rehmannia glutinosa]|uniref:Ribosomal protein S11 n=1 Tax=Rehmannia glutinosa TaxID=99300 RepID=A0ABR0XHA2_REHGL
MVFQRSLFGSTFRAEIHRQAFRVHGSGSGRAIHAFSQISQIAHAISGLHKNSIVETHLQSSIFRNLGVKLGLVRVAENASLPYAMSFRSFIHSGKQAEDEAGRAPPRSTDYLQGLLRERGNGVNGRPPLYPPQSESFQGLLQERGTVVNGRPPLYPPQESFQGLLQERGNNFNGRPPFYQQHQVESNADIVHIKLMRNNAFVTVTDSKGNKKIGNSAGKLAGKAGKLTRYSGLSGCRGYRARVRQMKTRSVVVKVNGFTFFRRKKDAILSFKDGFSNSRGDMNPVVYIEDTTRKPHNGCRLPKKRRI